MATPLDIMQDSGLFNEIFPFMFIFAVMYGLLSSIKPFGDDKGAVNVTIAAVLAFMSLFSGIVTDTINLAAPWFVLFIIFLLFIIIGFMVLGAKEADIFGVLQNPEYSYLGWWIVAIVLIIVIGSLSQVIAEKKGGYPPYGPGSNISLAEETGGELQTQESDFWKTIFHPKVLGFVALMLIAFFTISKLTTKG